MSFLGLDIVRGNASWFLGVTGKKWPSQIVTIISRTESFSSHHIKPLICYEHIGSDCEKEKIGQ